MLKKIKKSIEDFLRGYSIQKKATQELVARHSYFNGRANSSDLQAYIDSINDVQREVERMRHTPFENYGRRLYCLLHRELWEETLSEIGKQ